MGFELLLDENVEHEVLYKLRDRGHDVEHVESVPRLGKGASDAEVADTRFEPDERSSPTTTTSEQDSPSPTSSDSCLSPTERCRAKRPFGSSPR